MHALLSILILMSIMVFSVINKVTHQHLEAIIFMSGVELEDLRLLAVFDFDDGMNDDDDDERREGSQCSATHTHRRMKYIRMHYRVSFFVEGCLKRMKTWTWTWTWTWEWEWEPRPWPWAKSHFRFQRRRRTDLSKWLWCQ